MVENAHGTYETWRDEAVQEFVREHYGGKRISADAAGLLSITPDISCVFFANI